MLSSMLCTHQGLLLGRRLKHGTRWYRRAPCMHAATSSLREAPAAWHNMKLPVRPCRRAAAFIDGEAAVSDAEEWSSDEDGEGADQDLSGLINDATQEPGSVQPRRYT